MKLLKRLFILLAAVAIISIALTLWCRESNYSTNRFSKGIIRTPSKNKQDEDAAYQRQSRIPPNQERTAFNDESNFGPHCSMYTDAHKNLPWPDEPTDWTDWTYTRKRNCSKIEFPNNQTIANRTKLSLYCDKNGAELIPSLTNSSSDVQVIGLNSSCLSTYVNRCCNDDRGIPNIVHYVWYIQQEMPLYMFTSMMSVIRFIRPCLILFHGEILPYGKYWDYIINIYPNILHVKRPRPLNIFGTEIKYTAHSGDILRLEAMAQLGGIYIDTDFIVLRDLEPLRQYNITLCYQATNFLHSAFIMAKKNTTFLHLWMEGYRKDYRSDSYMYNAMEYNMDLANKKPNLIHIEDGTLCSPAYLIFRRSDDPNILYNWSALYGYHIYVRFLRVKTLNNATWDLNWLGSFNTTLGSMLRYVVHGNKELCDKPF